MRKWWMLAQSIFAAFRLVKSRENQGKQENMISGIFSLLSTSKIYLRQLLTEILLTIKWSMS